MNTIGYFIGMLFWWIIGHYVVTNPTLRIVCLIPIAILAVMAIRALRKGAPNDPGN